MIKKIRNLVLFAITIVVISAKQIDYEKRRNKISDVKYLQEALEDASAYMKTESKFENAAICLGTTRSGKSTLINYLIGNKLIAKRVSLQKPVAIIKADNSPGPPIGTGSTSETKLPTRWESSRFPELVFWDTPGFNDNRGSVQDITNAFYIHQLFRHVKSLKIILVTDINDIANDNIGPFLNLLSSVENLFKDRMIDCLDSMSIIFTKVPKVLNDNSVDKNFVSQLLEEQFLSSSDIDISEPAKAFIRFLIKNNQNFGFFKKVAVGEDVGDSIDEGITQAIKRTDSLKEDILKNVSPSISHESKVFLYNIRQELFSVEMFTNLLNTIEGIFSNKLSMLQDIGEDKEALNKFRLELTIIENATQTSVKSSISIPEKFESIKAIDPSLDKLVRDDNLQEKAIFMDFVDNILDMKDSNIIDSNLQAALISAQSKLDQMKLMIKIKLGEIDQKEAQARELENKQRFDSQLKNLTNQLEEMKQYNEESARRSGLNLSPVVDGLLLAFAPPVGIANLVYKAVNKS